MGEPGGLEKRGAVKKDVGEFTIPNVLPLVEGLQGGKQ